MTASLQWTDVHNDLKGIYSDLDRIQTRLYGDCLKVKNYMHDLQNVIKQVEEQISAQEASDDEKAHAEAEQV